MEFQTRLVSVTFCAGSLYLTAHKPGRNVASTDINLFMPLNNVHISLSQFSSKSKHPTNFYRCLVHLMLAKSDKNVENGPMEKFLVPFRKLFDKNQSRNM